MKICNNISCMKQILSTHNPKVVSSNLAPATKNHAFSVVFDLCKNVQCLHLPQVCHQRVKS